MLGALRTLDEMQGSEYFFFLVGRGNIVGFPSFLTFECCVAYLFGYIRPIRLPVLVFELRQP